MHKPRVSIIVAVSLNNAIGYRGGFPWNNLSADMKRFKTVTMGHAVVMGRKTWESLSPRFRPLPERHNIVLSRRFPSQLGTTCSVASSFEEAISLAGPFEYVFVIGGQEIYAMALPLAQRIYMTVVHGVFQADTFFPPIRLFEWERKEFQSFPADEKNPHPYSFAVFERVDFKENFL